MTVQKMHRGMKNAFKTGPRFLRFNLSISSCSDPTSSWCCARRNSMLCWYLTCWLSHGQLVFIFTMMPVHRFGACFIRKDAAADYQSSSDRHVVFTFTTSSICPVFQHIRCSKVIKASLSILFTLYEERIALYNFTAWKTGRNICKIVKT